MFSRDFGRQEGAKSKHIFESEGRRTAGEVVGCLPFACPLVQVCRLFGVQDLPEVALVLWWCVPLLLSSLLLFPWCVVCKYGSISHFKGVFRGFYGVCVGLYWPGALRGLWGFCVREWLGGLEACGVFASLFILLPFFFCSCVCLLLCWLSFFALVVFLCPLALSLWLFGCGCCFLFPCGIYAKRKGAPCWCVLSSCVVSVQILVTLSKNSVAVALARSNSFGW